MSEKGFLYMYDNHQATSQHMIDIGFGLGEGTHDLAKLIEGKLIIDRKKTKELQNRTIYDISNCKTYLVENLVETGSRYNPIKEHCKARISYAFDYLKSLVDLLLDQLTS
jgi:hypothetical protein